MRKASIVLITIAIEAVALWLVSIFFQWSYIDTIFLGGLAIFGLIWLYKFYFNQTNNEYSANLKGWNRQETNVIKPFQFNMSPITLGLLLFTVVSFFITAISYYKYF